MLDTLIGAFVESQLTVPVVPSNPSSVRAYVRTVSRDRGYSLAEWKCLDNILQRESHYRTEAVNGSFYGIGQVHNMKPGTPVQRQIKVIFKYIKHRYGTACNAWKFWKQHHWY